MKDKKSVGVCWCIYISIWNINYAEECIRAVFYESDNAELLSGQAAVDSSDPRGKIAQKLRVFLMLSQGLHLCQHQPGVLAALSKAEILEGFFLFW